jgi:hypothetical protein
MGPGADDTGDGSRSIFEMLYKYCGNCSSACVRYACLGEAGSPLT